MDCELKTCMTSNSHLTAFVHEIAVPISILSLDRESLVNSVVCTYLSPSPVAVSIRTRQYTRLSLSGKTL